MGKGVEFHEPFLKIALDEGIKIHFTSAYDGSPLGKTIKEAGRIWIHKCATLKHGISIARKGIDALVLVGLEGTGYKSPEQHTTMINITAGRRLLDIPIIAAGGIADGYELAGVLAMGAAGIYMGTAFMATQEFPLLEKGKQKIVNQEITDGRYIQKFYRMQHDVRHSPASGFVHSIPTVKDFIESIMVQARESLSRFADDPSIPVG
jgi:NAD(P)H-dependent flavin oxidoreductase YrpB (nitropropane dioxygenase family)